MDPQEDLELTIRKFLRWRDLRMSTLNTWSMTEEAKEASKICLVIPESFPGEVVVAHMHFSVSRITDEDLDWLKNQLLLRRYVFGQRRLAGPGSASLFCVTKWVSEKSVPEQDAGRLL